MSTEDQALKQFSNSEVISALRRVKMDSESKISDRVLKRAENKDNGAMDLAREVFEEGLSQFEEGDMEWIAMVEDMCKTLKAIDPKNLTGLQGRVSD